jgi:hypothetical protein
VSKKFTDIPNIEIPGDSGHEKQHTSIIQPIIDDLKEHTSTQLPSADEVAPPRGPLHPPQPAELDQDSGGGYNEDGAYPQT